MVQGVDVNGIHGDKHEKNKAKRERKKAAARENCAASVSRADFFSSAVCERQGGLQGGVAVLIPNNYTVVSSRTLVACLLHGWPSTKIERYCKGHQEHSLQFRWYVKKNI